MMAREGVEERVEKRIESRGEYGVKGRQGGERPKRKLGQRLRAARIP
jgi:hypothetical protein